MSFDWSSLDKYPEDNVECMCGAVYRSHSKFVMIGRTTLVARKPCPICKGTQLRRASSDPESISI